MKYQTRGSGSVGGVEYQHGEALVGDSEFARKMLVNRVFLPLDERAREFYDHPEQHAEYYSPGLRDLAAELDAKEK